MFKEMSRNKDLTTLKCQIKAHNQDRKDAGFLWERVEKVVGSGLQWWWSGEKWEESVAGCGGKWGMNSNSLNRGGQKTGVVFEKFT
uniref:Uncharacterized protein n=1 Tax=Tanacetum cinerariifolium TaxID=118510 RepID=A0A6L2KX05_TANCI|nr:hypothetical protein [Tanacetum cinerariifolium]